MGNCQFKSENEQDNIKSKSQILYLAFYQLQSPNIALLLKTVSINTQNFPLVATPANAAVASSLNSKCSNRLVILTVFRNQQIRLRVRVRDRARRVRQGVEGGVEEKPPAVRHEGDAEGARDRQAKRALSHERKEVFESALPPVSNENN